MKPLLLTVSIFFFSSFLCQGQTVTDQDGNVYDIITIGDQYWMGQNLKATHYRSGDLIQETANDTTNVCWDLNPAYRWAYEGNTANVATYGWLYSFHAVTDSRNICPTGWHVPQDHEWNHLAQMLGGTSVAGGKLKEGGTSHWLAPNTGASNLTGFSAVPGGHRLCTGGSLSLQSNAFYWSSTPNGTDYGICWKLFYADEALTQDSVYGYKSYGFSVRCIADSVGTGFIQQKNEIKTSLFPNPAESELFIRYEGEGPALVSILNLNGSLLFKKEIQPGFGEIDIRSLSSGIFLVRVQTPKGTKTEKLVVR